MRGRGGGPKGTTGAVRGEEPIGFQRSGVHGSGIQGKSGAKGDAGASDLSCLIRISREVGADPDLIQGTGGNTSIKTRDGRTIYIKVSGGILADMDEGAGWAELDLDLVRGILDRPDLPGLPEEERDAEVERLLRAAVRRPRGTLPSVETGLHALLDRVVIHTHPVGLNALLCSRDSRDMFSRVVGGEGGPPLYVRYTDPGFACAARVKDDIEEHRARHGAAPRVVLLENHGLFVAAPEPDACLDLHRAVVERGSRWIGGTRINPLAFGWTLEPSPGSGAEDLRSSPCRIRGALLRGGAAPCAVRADRTPIAAEFLAMANSIVAARQGAFTPDQIVYCRTQPLILDATAPEGWEESVAAYRERHGLDPRVILSPPSGAFRGAVHYAAPDLGQVRAAGDVYRSAMTFITRTEAGGGPRFLNREQGAYIERLYAAKTRAAPGPPRQLEGRVAVVTGAASGLGRAIARGLAEAGATVAALDIHQDGLEAASADFPGGRCLPVACDVTDEGSVASAFRMIEESAGGLDYLVNAAGIAPSYPLADFPLEAWRKTLEINLTGYFLCAREAARLLLRQGAGGSIINLTSKSGLEASKENSAYNATKAGEIHLMRGWALELGPVGIRVNCVAPGNVFKGSRIWNDEYIRACARKKGIRPEEVIPHYTSLTALGKEIEPDDIANAVIFLLSDEARTITGQTLVVDGGQVMVR